MKINSELVSIITPNYNGGAYIEATIKSVISQTYTNWELIIVDDCSSDDSLSVIEKYRNDDRIHLLKHEKNSGVIVSRNYGISQAKGRYIAFLDSDDVWLPEKLFNHLNFMRENAVGFSFTSYTIISSKDLVLGHLIAPETVDYRKLLSKCDIGCSTVIYDTSFLDKQFFDVKAPQSREDYVLWLKIAKTFSSIPMLGLQKTLTLYRKHDQGISAKKSKAGMKIWRVYRDVEKLDFFTAAYHMILYTFNGVKKHYFTLNKS